MKILAKRKKKRHSWWFITWTIMYNVCCMGILSVKNNNCLHKFQNSECIWTSENSLGTNLKKANILQNWTTLISHQVSTFKQPTPKGYKYNWGDQVEILYFFFFLSVKIYIYIISINCTLHTTLISV